MNSIIYSIQYTLQYTVNGIQYYSIQYTIYIYIFCFKRRCTENVMERNWKMKLLQYCMNYVLTSAFVCYQYVHSYIFELL